MDKMTPIKAIKIFFEADGGRPPTSTEMKALTKDDRHELGELAAKELNVELDIS